MIGESNGTDPIESVDGREADFDFWKVSFPSSPRLSNLSSPLSFLKTAPNPDLPLFC